MNIVPPYMPAEGVSRRMSARIRVAYTCVNSASQRGSA